MIIAITGGRDHVPTPEELHAFTSWCVQLEASVVRHGDCPLRKRKSDGKWSSVDRLVAQHLQRTTYLCVDPWPALWDLFPRWEAGPRRNRCMLSGDRSDWGRELEQLADRLVAWPGGPGTGNCVREAGRLGITTVTIASIAQAAHLGALRGAR